MQQCLGNGVALHAFVEQNHKNFKLPILFTRSPDVSLRLSPGRNTAASTGCLFSTRRVASVRFH
jgi:hypothetical protein